MAASFDEDKAAREWENDCSLSTDFDWGTIYAGDDEASEEQMRSLFDAFVWNATTALLGKLLRAIESLPADQREALSLKLANPRISQRELGRRLGVDHKTAARTLAKAFTALKRAGDRSPVTREPTHVSGRNQDSKDTSTHGNQT